jgi:hypothetical protein
MPVWKFRTLDDARRALWASSEDPDLLQRMVRLAAMAGPPRPVRRGVTRYRTIAEAKCAKGAHYQPHPELIPP